VESREQKKKRLRHKKYRLHDCREQAVPCLQRLIVIIEDIKELADDPVSEFAAMFNDLSMATAVEQIIYPAVAQGVHYSSFSAKKNITYDSCQSAQVENIYLKVVDHLKNVGSWEKTVHKKFPEKAIKGAIRRVLSRFELSEKEDEYKATFDWGIELETLREHEEIDTWLDSLERKIPRDYESIAYSFAMNKLFEDASYLGCVVLTEKEYNRWRLAKNNKSNGFPSK
jgi:hypothetical protein